MLSIGRFKLARLTRRASKFEWFLERPVVFIMQILPIAKRYIAWAALAACDLIFCIELCFLWIRL